MHPFTIVRWRKSVPCAFPLALALLIAPTSAHGQDLQSAPHLFRGDRLDALDDYKITNNSGEARPTSPLTPAKKASKACLFCHRVNDHGAPDPQDVNETRARLDNTAHIGRFIPGPKLPMRTLVDAAIFRDGKLLLSVNDGRRDLAHHQGLMTHHPESNIFKASSDIYPLCIGSKNVFLADGRLLALGGYRLGKVQLFAQDKAFIVDPATNKSIETNPMHSKRYPGLDAILLKSGEVLVCGGGNKGYPLTSKCIEIFTPATGCFRKLDCPSFLLESSPVLTLLEDGQVLMTGIQEEGLSTTKAMLFASETETFHALPPLSTPRSGHQATLLQDGKVLLSGGWQRTDKDEKEIYSATTDIFDPVSGAFHPGGTLLQARAEHSATLLLDGKVLITGGNTPEGLTDHAELFDPEAQNSQSLPKLPFPVSEHGAVALPNGRQSPDHRRQGRERYGFSRHHMV